MPTRNGGASFTRVALVAALALLAWCAWSRWGPVPEPPVPPGAEVRQWIPTTCGPAALATLLNVYGRSWSREALEQECEVTSEGTSLYHLREACRRYGLSAEGLRAIDSKALLRVPRPFIAHLTTQHFVVVERLSNGHLEVFDPTLGDVRAWSSQELFRVSRGWVLTVGERPGRTLPRLRSANTAPVGQHRRLLLH